MAVSRRDFVALLLGAFDAMLEALGRGEITDAKTVAALLLYARRRTEPRP